jgi:hypothetical protein
MILNDSASIELSVTFRRKEKGIGRKALRLAAGHCRLIAVNDGSWFQEDDSWLQMPAHGPRETRLRGRLFIFLVYLRIEFTTPSLRYFHQTLGL